MKPKKPEGRFCMLTGNTQRMEDLVDFPTDYDFKIMGKTEELDIEGIIRQMESVVDRPVSRELVRTRPSSGGKYTSYTVRVYLDAAEQLTAIYQMLSLEKTILYYL